MKHFTKAVGSLLCVVALTLTCFGGCVNQNSPGNSSSGTSKTESTTSTPSGNTSSVSAPGDPSESSSSISVPSNPFDSGSSESSSGGKVPGNSSGAADQEDDFGSFIDSRILQFDNTKVTNADFGGTSFLYSGYHFHPDDITKSFTEQELQWEIDKVLSMGISMVRANFYISWVWDYTNNRYDYNTEDMEGFYRFAEILKKNNIKLALVINEHINNSFDGRQGPFVILAGGQDPDKCAEEAGKFAADFVQEVIINRKFDNIEYFEMFTEPGNEVYGLGNEAMKNRFDRHLKVFKAIHEELTARGLRKKIKIMGPNISMTHVVEPYITYSLSWLRWTVEYADEYVDVYSIHTYSRVTVTDDDYEHWLTFLDLVSEVIKPTGKRLCVDEFGYDDPRYDIDDLYNGPFYDPLASVHYATAYIAFMNNGLVSNATIWSLADEKWPRTIRNGAEFKEGVQMTGVAIPNIRNSIKLKPAYYLLSALGRAIQRGCQTYAGESIESGAYGTLVKNPDGSQSLVVVNIGLTSMECTYQFSKSLNGATLYKYVFDQSVTASKYDKPLAVKKTFQSVKTEFTDTLKAYTVAIYTTKKLYP